MYPLDINLENAEKRFLFLIGKKIKSGFNEMTVFK